MEKSGGERARPHKRARFPERHDDGLLRRLLRRVPVEAGDGAAPAGPAAVGNPHTEIPDEERGRKPDLQAAPLAGRRLLSHGSPPLMSPETGQPSDAAHLSRSSETRRGRWRRWWVPTCSEAFERPGLHRG